MIRPLCASQGVGSHAPTGILQGRFCGRSGPRRQLQINSRTVQPMVPHGAPTAGPYDPSGRNGSAGVQGSGWNDVRLRPGLSVCRSSTPVLQRGIALAGSGGAEAPRVSFFKKLPSAEPIYYLLLVTNNNTKSSLAKEFRATVLISEESTQATIAQALIPPTAFETLECFFMHGNLEQLGSPSIKIQLRQRK